MAADQEFDVCVIGGGPAGATAALRLAQLGRRVCLLERALIPRPHVGVSLPGSVWPVLQVLGLADRVAAAGFLRTTGSVLYWAGEFERRGPAAGAPGLIVDRGRFDALLLSAARNAGVQVFENARAYRPQRSGSGWIIPSRIADKSRQFRAQVLLDAAGRQAGLGRRVRPASRPLLALHAYWHAPAGFDTQTRVEAGAAQWYWGAKLPDETVSAMVFVDPARATGLSPAQRRDLYLNLIAQSTLLSPCLEQRRIGPVRRCDATSLYETTPPTPDLLRVGEASFCVDALSSQGVQLAMAQAVQAAVVINTVLHKPNHTDLALTFYAERQAERVRTHATLAAEYYARQQIVSPEPFWQDRAQPLPGFETQSPTLMQSPVSPETALRLSPEAQLVLSGVQTATLIEPTLVLTHANLPRPVASIDGIALAPLLEHLGTSTTGSQLLAAWGNRIGPQSAMRLLDWLWRNQILIPAR